MGELNFAATQAVKNCMKLQNGEKAIIITDELTSDIAKEVYKVCEEVSKGNTKIFKMEDYGERTKRGDHPLVFPEEIKEELKNADVSFYMAQAKMGELKSFRMPMIEIVEKNPKLRHAHMPGITEKMMKTGMSVDYNEVKTMCQKVYDLVKEARYVRVTTPRGTDFKAYFSNHLRWIISDGDITSENWSNLPDGEVFTCVDDIPEGKIVVDGIFGDYFCERYGILEDDPVELTIKDSRVTEISCGNIELIEDIKDYMAQDENANRIGEFAIGTNIGLTNLIGNLLQDEKFPGVHIAIGHGYPTKTGSKWDSDAHVDAVMQNCTIYVEEKMIMKDGKFVI